MTTPGSRKNLAGHTAIVTGAGQGIGRSIAQRLAEDGADVLVVGRREQPLADVVDVITQADGSAWYVSADIATQAGVDKIVDAAIDRWGRIDILVNNAAVFDEPPFLEVSADTVRETFGINVVGTFMLSQRVAKEMIEPGKGSIVHISSVDVFGADGPVTAYSATKAAVASMARTMTMELAPHGLRVNTVAPGFVNTDMVHKTSTPNVIDHMLHDFQRVPMRRLVEPQEIAAAVSFLASDEASAITGTTLIVDGGLTSNLYVMETLPEEMIPLGTDTHES
jgi:NAD(P)-dependent dehydrogenase (short-subunit alcohol dehydrogenase family)